MQILIAYRWRCTNLHYLKSPRGNKLGCVDFALLLTTTHSSPLLSFWRLEYLGIGLFMSLLSIWRATNHVASNQDSKLTRKDCLRSSHYCEVHTHVRRKINIMYFLLLRGLVSVQISFYISFRYLIIITSLGPHNLKIKIKIIAHTHSIYTQLLVLYKKLINLNYFKPDKQMALKSIIF